MFKLTKTCVFCLSVIIIFCLIQIFINQYKIETEVNEEIMEEINIIVSEIETQEEVKIVERTSEKAEIWQIEIPKISLIANIAEGTTKEVLNQYVGHFEESQTECGNIALAAHNRGYKVNYFKDLKKLEQGDVIKYKHNEFEKIYEVEKCRIIKDTEWEYLENTDENMLTLITCVENQPEYRRCIQAIEKEEEIY